MVRSSLVVPGRQADDGPTMFFGGQSPFDHRQVPASADDVGSADAQLCCLVLTGALITISVLGYLLTRLM